VKSKKKKKPESGGNNVPAYIVTYSDMITLLLTFFVMLLSLSNQQDPELFNVGRDSFVKSIQSLGLGMLIGTDVRAKLKEKNIEHYIKDPDSSDDKRTIDSKTERLRRAYQRITENMDSYPPQITAENVNFAVTPIKFQAESAVLQDDCKNQIKRFCEDVTEQLNRNNLKFYVLGLAGDVLETKESWFVSARRAEKVADIIRTQKPEKSEWSVFCWGVGAGGKWVEKDNPAYEKTQILIAVLQ
jgi:flagellar motor protein MotB